MSEILPPIIGTGVTLHFVFPFDGQMPRHADIVWRKTLSGRNMDTRYAEIRQSGEACVVHEQVTFPGDCWVVLEKSGGVPLALHVATGEREQRILITRQTRTAAAAMVQQALRQQEEQEQEQQQQVQQQEVQQQEEGGEGAAQDDEDEELEAAIRESLRTASAEAAKTASSSADTAKDEVTPDLAEEQPMRDALALSKRLAEACRLSARATKPTPGSSGGKSTSAGSTETASYAGGAGNTTAAAPPPAVAHDAEAMRQARLRRFGGDAAGSGLSSQA